MGKIEPKFQDSLLFIYPSTWIEIRIGMAKTYYWDKYEWETANLAVTCMTFRIMRRGFNLVRNRLMPGSKCLSSLMLYATDRCDSGCKHCLIWAKRPTTVLAYEAIVRIMASKCVHPSTMVGLEGGEFLLHPDADTKILGWFAKNHPSFDLFSNCLQPERLIGAVREYRPHRLW